MEFWDSVVVLQSGITESGAERRDGKYQNIGNIGMEWKVKMSEIRNGKMVKRRENRLNSLE